LKILFAWEWGAGSGHLHRFLPLASRLRNEGHRVTIASKELHRLPRLFPVEDYGYLQAPDSGRAANVIASGCSFADIAFNLGFSNDNNVLAICAAWNEILKQQSPDLVISDFGVGCLWVAAAMKLPTVRIGTGYTCPPQGSESISFLDDTQSSPRAADEILASVTSAMRTLGLGFECCWNDILLPPSRTILASLPTLDPYVRLRSSDDYAGMWDHDGHAPPQWQGTGQHKAVAYLKPFPQFRQLIASLHSAGIETVLYGDGISRDLIDPVRNPLLQVSDAPLRLSGLAGKCDFVICNGNHGTTAKALAQGIPVLAIPLFLEQRVNANRIEREGWGVSVDPRATDQFAAKFDAVTCSSLRESAAGYPNLVAQYDNRGLDEAWRKIQPFLK
jgi:UDP-glucoronosyl and UDP-glucosyl transferase